MSADIRSALGGVALALAVEVQTGGPISAEWNGRRERAAAGAIVAAPQGQAALLDRGVFMHDLDDTDERGSAIHHGRWTALHFDAVDVVEIEGIGGGVERAAPRNTVDYQKISVHLLQSPELRHRASRPLIASLGDGDTRGQCQGTAEVANTALAKLFAAKYLDSDWYLFRILRQTRGGYFNRLLHRRYLLLGGCRRLWSGSGWHCLSADKGGCQDEEQGRMMFHAQSLLTYSDNYHE